MVLTELPCGPRVPECSPSGAFELHRNHFAVERKVERSQPRRVAARHDEFVRGQFLRKLFELPEVPVIFRESKEQPIGSDREYREKDQRKQRLLQATTGAVIARTRRWQPVQHTTRIRE